MDFKKCVSFGRTGLMVIRIGLAQAYGVPAAAIEKAFHKYGITYFYVSPFLKSGFVNATVFPAPLPPLMLER